MSPARTIGLIIAGIALSIGAYVAIRDWSIVPLAFAGLVAWPFAVKGT